MRNFLLGAFVASAIWAAWHGNAQDYLVLSGVVAHLDGNGYCNSRFTKGVGIEKGDYQFGIYDNSNCEWSIYAAKAWLPVRIGDWRIGGLAGGVTGYGPPVTPVAGFAAAYEPGRWGVNVVLVPPAGESSGVAWFQLKRKW